MAMALASLSSSLGGLSSSSSGTVAGRDFFDLVKAIGESKSKQEEDRIIAEEVLYLKKAIPQYVSNKKKTKELVVRALYVEMLGQDASFAYIKAVELCASTNIKQKRVGYLAASLCLSPTHEFRFMLVNQIQRDINSTNHLEACAALSAVCKIVNEDMIPAVIGDVLKVLRHDVDAVRRKAVCALHRLYQLDKTCCIDHVEKVRRMICDKDPSVMGASLGLLHAMIIDTPNNFKDLVPSLVSILKQVSDHRLPKEYDYHRVPAPWIQMHLLRMLAVLGRGDRAASEGTYEVILEVMRKADTGVNVGYAIVFEAVQTVTIIYPSPTLLDAAATSISRFIRSESHNLKYIGIKGLALIVREHPRYAADHQMAVIDCLEDPDETLKRKTLDLLYRMTNAVNVEFIVAKLLSHLTSASAIADEHFRTDLVNQITQCSERFAPSNGWYIHTVIKVFELAGDKVKPSVAQTLTQLIAEGSEDDDDTENQSDNIRSRSEGERSDDVLRREAVEDFLVLLDTSEKKLLPEVLVQCASWVLGEYGYLSNTCTKVQIMLKFCDLIGRLNDRQHNVTRAHCVTALMKLVAQNGACPAVVIQRMQLLRQSASLEIQQRATEFLRLLSLPEVLVEALPVDASCEDVEVNRQLPFLDVYVSQALANGAKPYHPPEHLFSDSLDGNDHDGRIDGYAEKTMTRKGGGLIVAPYERPALPTTSFASSSGPLSHGSGGIGDATAVGTGVMTIGGGVTPLKLPHTTTSASPLFAGMAGGSGLGGHISSDQGGGSTTPNPQLLNLRGVTQVWGKPPPAPVVSTPSATNLPPPALSFTPTSTAAPSASAAVSVNRTMGSTSQDGADGGGSPVVLTEKQKLAAALFGGIASSSSSSSSSSTTAQQQRQPSFSSPSSSSTSTTIATKSNVPSTSNGTDTNQTVADLLNMSINTTRDGDSSIAEETTATTVASAATDVFSLLNASLGSTTQASSSAAAVSGASSGSQNDNNKNNNDDLLLLMQPIPTQPSTLPPNPPLPVLPLSATSSYALHPSPLPMTTEIFGQHWTASHAVEAAHSCALPITARVRTLEQLRALLTHPVPGSGSSAGGGGGGSGVGGGCYAHVESIAATTEAIYAATAPTKPNLGDNNTTAVMLLLHVRLHLMRASMDITMRAIVPTTNPSSTPSAGAAGGATVGSLSSQGQGLVQGMITIDDCLVELKRLANLFTKPSQS